MPTRKISTTPQSDYENGYKLCKISQCIDDRIRTMHAPWHYGSWHRHVFLQNFGGTPARVVLLKLNTDIVVTPAFFRFLLDSLKSPADVLASHEKLDDYFAPREKGKHLLEFEQSQTTKEEYYTYRSDVDARNKELNNEITSFLFFSQRLGISLRKDTHAVGFSFAAKKPNVLNLELKFVVDDLSAERFHTGIHKQKAVVLNIHVDIANPRDRIQINTLQDFNQQLAKRVHQFSMSFCKGMHCAALNLESDFDTLQKKFFLRDPETFQSHTYSFLRMVVNRKKLASAVQASPPLSKMLAFTASPVFKRLPSVETPEQSFDSQFPALK